MPGSSLPFFDATSLHRADGYWEFPKYPVKHGLHLLQCSHICTTALPEDTRGSCRRATHFKRHASRLRSPNLVATRHLRLGSVPQGLLRPLRVSLLQSVLSLADLEREASSVPWEQV